MATILNIETSTDVCSVCLSHDGEMKFHDADYKGRNHATVLGGFVKNALDYAKMCEMKLDAVAVSIGLVPTRVCASACRKRKACASVSTFR